MKATPFKILILSPPAPGVPGRPPPLPFPLLCLTSLLSPAYASSVCPETVTIAHSCSPDTAQVPGDLSMCLERESTRRPVWTPQDVSPGCFLRLISNPTIRKSKSFIWLPNPGPPVFTNSNLLQASSVRGRPFGMHNAKWNHVRDLWGGLYGWSQVWGAIGGEAGLEEELDW